MRLERYIVAKDLPSGVSFLAYSSHRKPAKAFAAMDKLRRTSKVKGLYVRDRYWGNRVRRDAQSEEGSHVSR